MSTESPVKKRGRGRPPGNKSAKSTPVAVHDERTHQSQTKDESQEKDIDQRLRAAARCDEEQNIRKLIQEGASVNAISTRGNSALTIAAIYGKFENVKLLVEEFGADIHQKNKVGKTALDCAHSQKCKYKDGTGYDQIISFLSARAGVSTEPRNAEDVMMDDEDEEEELDQKAVSSVARSDRISSAKQAKPHKSKKGRGKKRKEREDKPLSDEDPDSGSGDDDSADLLQLTRKLQSQYQTLIAAVEGNRMEETLSAQGDALDSLVQKAKAMASEFRQGIGQLSADDKSREIQKEKERATVAILEQRIKDRETELKSEKISFQDKERKLNETISDLRDECEKAKASKPSCISCTRRMAELTECQSECHRLRATLPAAPAIISVPATSHGSLSSSLSILPASLLRDATGCFERGRRIGAGRYAEIYRGHISSGQLRGLQVAVRKLHSISHNLDFLSRLDVLTKIRHPSLLPVWGVCLDSNFVSLVSPLLQGSLDRRLAVTPSLNFFTRLKIAAGISDALSFLHARDEASGRNPLVHGDLKSSNILLDQNSNPKVCDLGSGAFSSAVVPHAFSFGYVDPDLLTTGRYEARHDCYAMGVVFMELLTGLSAFDPQTHPDSPLLISRVTTWLQSPPITETPVCGVDVGAEWPPTVSENFARIAAGLVGMKDASGSPVRLTAVEASNALADLIESCVSSAGGNPAEDSSENNSNNNLNVMMGLKKQGVCMVCMFGIVNSTFSCGHSVACIDCAELLQKRGSTCPICQQHVYTFRRMGRLEEGGHTTPPLLLEDTYTRLILRKEGSQVTDSE